MSETKIEWTDYTANPWEGCQKVSPACDNCYAEVGNKRYYGGSHWGPKGPRREVKNWRQKINEAKKAAIAAGHKKRVFIASLSDIFEKPMPLVDAAGNNLLNGTMPKLTSDLRTELWRIIHKTPQLTFLLLTKRPSNIKNYVPDLWQWYPPQNVWFGCSISNQEEADMHIPVLMQTPGIGNKFLSIEPMLGPIKLPEMSTKCDKCRGTGLYYTEEEAWYRCEDCNGAGWLLNIAWVIVGGESGSKSKARPIYPEWIAGIKRDCELQGIYFFFKQWGNHNPHFASDLPDTPVEMIYVADKTANDFPFGSGIKHLNYPPSMTAAL